MTPQLAEAIHELEAAGAIDRRSAERFARWAGGRRGVTLERDRDAGEIVIAWRSDLGPRTISGPELGPLVDVLERGTIERIDR